MIREEGRERHKGVCVCVCVCACLCEREVKEILRTINKRNETLDKVQFKQLPYVQIKHSAYI